MSFINLFNFFILTSQFILQLYYMFMFIANAAKSFIFNDKTMINFFK